MRIPGVPFVPGRNDYPDRDGRHYGIAIHNTSNDASDSAEASWAQRRPDGVSSHLYVDRDSVTQSLDLTARAGHAGSREGNDHAIAVEITGGNGVSRAWWLDNVAWTKLGLALAWVIKNDPDFAGFQVRRATVAEMRYNPRVKAFYGHDDMRRAWGGTTHTDPGPSFPWDRLIAAVNAGLATLGGRPAPAPPKPSTPARPPAPLTRTEQIVKALPTLGRGDQGAGVRRLQALLNAAGQKISEDGAFGPGTEAAVRAEQRQGGITVDGVAGPNTWAVLLGVR